MLSERFAGRLRELREQAGLTQEQLADKAGLTKWGITDLERGRRSPTWGTVLVLCEALGVDCTAFTQAPATESKRGRGRPRKMAGASMGKPSAAPKRRGKPKRA